MPEASTSIRSLQTRARAPLGLKPQTGSPAIRKANGTPSWVTDDFVGIPRAKPSTIGGFECVPRASFVPFGVGCAGASGHVPVIGFSGALRLGSTDFAVTLSKARGGAVQAWFALGASKVAIPIGMGCNLLVSPDLLIATGVSGTAPGTGTARLPFMLPNDPKLRGASVYLQWGVVDPAASGNFAFSNAATLTL